MKIKLIPIKGCKTCKEVLIYVDRDAMSESIVKIVAWHSTDDLDIIQSAEVDYNDTDNPDLMHSRFVADFSEASANEFANSFKF
jgi:hypothetical protein